MISFVDLYQKKSLRIPNKVIENKFIVFRENESSFIDSKEFKKRNTSPKRISATYPAIYID